MGLYLNSYAGPVLVAERHFGHRTIQVNACPNTACKKHGLFSNDRFCGNCGQAITSVTAQSSDPTDMPNYAEIIDALEKVGHNEDSFVILHGDHGPEDVTTHNWVFLPNLIRQFGREFHLSDPENYSLDMSTVHMSEEVEWFKTEHAVAIEAISKLLPNTRVTWMILNYKY